MAAEIPTRTFPLIISDGVRESYVEIVNGELIHGGDLPTSEAAAIFLIAISREIVKVNPELFSTMH